MLDFLTHNSDNVKSVLNKIKPHLYNYITLTTTNKDLQLTFIHLTDNNYQVIINRNGEKERYAFTYDENKPSELLQFTLVKETQNSDEPAQPAPAQQISEPASASKSAPEPDNKGGVKL